MSESVVEKTKESIKKVTYPRGSVGKNITIDIPIINPNQSIEVVKESLKEFAANSESINYIYVVNEDSKLIGVASIKEVLKDKNHKLIKEIMNKKVISTHVQVNRKRAAHLAVKHNIKALPVLDEEEKFIGVLTSDKLLAILHQEHREDIYRAAGIVSMFGNILQQGVWYSFISRLPWILVGLIGGLFSAQVIQVFEGVLEVNIILAVFIPLIVYIGNAVGAQTQAFFVRDIAFDPKLKILKYFFKQLITASLIGVICGLVIWSLVSLFWQSSYIGFVIGLSAFTAISFSTFIAISIPYIFFIFKRDPATGSGPFATILQDLTSISVYFVIASLML